MEKKMFTEYQRKLVSIYSLAKAYLIDMIDDENAVEILEEYLTPHDCNQVEKLSQIYFHLLKHAQNANMKPKVIGQSIGGVKKLKPILFNFNAKKVLEHYGDDHEKLLDDIVEELQPTGQVKREPKGLWVHYCQSILSAAQFLCQFKNSKAFYEWANEYYQDETKIDELPQILAREIHGIGYALACDFLKEMGFANYGKPDVHIKDILRGVGLTKEKAKETEIQAVLREMAKVNGVSAYHVDKILWLIGSGEFYFHDFSTGQNKQDFIDWFVEIDKVGR